MELQAGKSKLGRWHMVTKWSVPNIQGWLTDISSVPYMSLEYSSIPPFPFQTVRKSSQVHYRCCHIIWSPIHLSYAVCTITSYQAYIWPTWMWCRFTTGHGFAKIRCKKSRMMYNIRNMPFGSENFFR